MNRIQASIRARLSSPCVNMAKQGLNAGSEIEGSDEDGTPFISQSKACAYYPDTKKPHYLELHPQNMEFKS